MTQAWVFCLFHISVRHISAEGHFGQNFSVTEHFGHGSFRSGNISVTELFGQRTFRSRNILVTEHFGHRTFRSRNFSVTEHLGHRTFRSGYISVREHFGQGTFQSQIFSVREPIIGDLDTNPIFEWGLIWFSLTWLLVPKFSARMLFIHPESILPTQDLSSLFWPWIESALMYSLVTSPF